MGSLDHTAHHVPPRPQPLPAKECRDQDLLSSQSSKHPPQAQINLGMYLLNVPIVQGREVPRMIWRGCLPKSLENVPASVPKSDSNSS